MASDFDDPDDAADLFVLNSTGGRGRMIHTTECPAIKSMEWDLASGWVTRQSLASLGRSYRRCESCCPDVPEDLPHRLKSTSVVARHIGRAHLGRYFRGVGRLDRIVTTRDQVVDQVVLEGAEGRVTLSADDRVEYWRARPQPVNSEPGAEEQ